MADVKVSGLPSDTSLDGNHYTILNDPVGPTTKRTLLSTLAAFFFNQVNIPDGSGSPRTRMTEFANDFVASGCVWSGDAYGSTRLASMTSGIVYINGRRLIISAVVSRTFTASKDTYVDILDNGDGTATIVYTEVANNAASPALASNSLRIGIIVTGASNIANAGSVNQGQEDKVLPIVSSVPYAVVDSLGNMICSRDPNRKIIGFRQILTSFSSTTTGATAGAVITGLSTPVKVPTGRKIRAAVYPYASIGPAGSYAEVYIHSGASLNAQTTKQAAGQIPGGTSGAPAITTQALWTPTTSNFFITASLWSGNGGTATVYGAASGAPMQMIIELD